MLANSGLYSPDKPISEFTEQELHDFLYKPTTKLNTGSGNVTYDGLITKLQRTVLSKDRESMQPHVRAFVDRAVTFAACPDCRGARLNEAEAAAAAAKTTKTRKKS